MAVIFLSKKQAIAVAERHGATAPNKPNKRVQWDESGVPVKMWHMPVAFRKKIGEGKGKCFRLSAPCPDVLIADLKTASKSGRRAVLTYENQ
jgi:hypothetical protein